MTVSFFINPHRRQETLPLTDQIVNACAELDLRLLTKAARNDGTERSAPSDAEMVEQSDVIVVAGGDGTVLHAAGLAARFDKPILAMHTGNIGFLSEITPKCGEQITEALLRVKNGDYAIEERMMLRSTIIEPARATSTAPNPDMDEYPALNDVVITRGSYSRMTRFHVEAGDVLIGGFDGDGLIVSTPTGSTGYSLSAGGSIVAPGISAIILSPICPHANTARPIVLPCGDVITIDATCPAEAGGILLTLDGRAPILLGRKARVAIRRSETNLKFVRFDSYPFFSRVREKLSQWN